MKKLVIVTEALIRDEVIEEITKLGCRGYTVQRATGKGESGMRSSDIAEYFSNVRMEVIVDEEVAQKVASEVVKKFFGNYAGIVYMQDVEVIRARKFRAAK